MQFCKWRGACIFTGLSLDAQQRVRMEWERGIGEGTQDLTWQVRPTLLIWWNSKDF